MKNIPTLVLKELKNSFWHMLPENVQSLLNIVNRENALQKAEALLARDGEPLTNSQKTTIRDGVALIPVNGPIFPKANLFTEISGATSLEMLAKDFTTSLENPEVQAIIFEMDTPGGSVQGLSEFSNMVRNARGTKPIVTFVTGQGASAGYFIGSASDQMIVAPEAMVGAIGTIVNIMDASKAEEKEGFKEFRFTSKVSPRKNLPVTSKQGQEQIQNIVDKLGEIFVEAVAENRGVTVDTVLNDFGQGDVLIGQDAVEAGMVDSVGSLEEVISMLGNRQTNNNNNNQVNFNNNGDDNMKPEDIAKLTLEDISNHNPELLKNIKDSVDTSIIKNEAKAEGIALENKRIKTIEGLKTPANSKIIDDIKFNSDLDEGKAALEVLKVMNAKDETIKENIKNDNDDFSDSIDDLETTEVTAETKAEAKKSLITNMVSGGNNARPKNLSVLDKVNIESK